MDFIHARSWDQALAAKAERPDAVPISGGTDLMVDLNFDRRRPDVLLDLNGVAALGEWERVDGHVRIGAGVPFTRIIDEIGPLSLGWRSPCARSARRRSATAAPWPATSPPPRPPATRCRRW